MVHAAAGPVVALRELRRHVEEVLGLGVGIQGDGAAALGLAVVVRLVARELVAVIVVQVEREDVALAVPRVVGLRVGAARVLPVASWRAVQREAAFLLLFQLLI